MERFFTSQNENAEAKLCFGNTCTNITSNKKHIVKEATLLRILFIEQVIKNPIRLILTYSRKETGAVLQSFPILIRFTIHA